MNLTKINRHDIRSEIQRLAYEIKHDLFDNKRGQWGSIAIDGWKNTVSNCKHLTVILFFCDKPTIPIFLKSFVLSDTSAISISSCILEVLQFLDEYEIKVIAGVTDNAKNMIAAMKLIQEKRSTIIPLRCAAHCLNLMVKDAFNEVDFLKKSFKVLTEYIKIGKIKRYCETRWNGVYERLCDMLKYLTLHESWNVNIIEQIANSISAIEPLINLLNLSQGDGTNWIEFNEMFHNTTRKIHEAGRDGLYRIISGRTTMLLNPITKLLLFLDKKIELNEIDIQILIKWFDALEIPDFEKFVADCEFHQNVDIPWKLKLFIKFKIPGIAISEASVERCFSVHKRIHSSFRASLSNDIVEDLLFIRYNQTFLQSEYDDHSGDEECVIVPLNDND